MQQEKIKTSICWILTVICMGVIFWFSSRTAEQSSEQSGVLLEWLIKYFGDNFFTTFIVRKLAHFLEFTGLCVLFNLALFQTKRKLMPISSIICTSVYAITDEIHQLYVPGRSCELRDWAIDSAGAICGSIGFLLLYCIIKGIVKKKNSIDTKNI